MESSEDRFKRLEKSKPPARRVQINVKEDVITYAESTERAKPVFGRDWTILEIAPTIEELKRMASRRRAEDFNTCVGCVGASLIALVPITLCSMMVYLAAVEPFIQDNFQSQTTCQEAIVGEINNWEDVNRVIDFNVLRNPRELEFTHSAISVYGAKPEAHLKNPLNPARTSAVIKAAEEVGVRSYTDEEKAGHLIAAYTQENQFLSRRIIERQIDRDRKYYIARDKRQLDCNTQIVEKLTTAPQLSTWEVEFY